MGLGQRSFPARTIRRWVSRTRRERRFVRVFAGDHARGPQRQRCRQPQPDPAALRSDRPAQRIGYTCSSAVVLL